MIFYSPTEEPVHIGLTSGRATLITVDGADIEEYFYAEAYLRGCFPHKAVIDSVAVANDIIKPVKQVAK